MKHIITSILLIYGISGAGQQINGHVYWPDGQLMDYPVTLHIEFDGCPSMNHDVSFANGVFGPVIFNPLLDCDSIRISLSGEANARDGVSTLDLVILLKHLLGKRPFTTVLQQITGDVNNSESLSALDLVEIRKLILGYYQEWQNNGVLKFFVKTTSSPPPVGALLKSTYVFSKDDGNQVINFWGVKTAEFGHF